MFNKLVLSVLLSLSLAFSFVGSANATLISQDILFDTYFDSEDTFEVIGQLTISLDTMDDWGEVNGTWESFSFFGYDVDTFDAGWNLFIAVIDPGNIAAGIESLDFDVTIFSDLSFAGYIDVYDPFNSVSFSIFDNADPTLLNAGNLAFGEVSIVPTPATIVLFLTAIMGLMARRQR